MMWQTRRDATRRDATLPDNAIRIDRRGECTAELSCSAAARRLSLENLVASFLYVLLPLRVPPALGYRYPYCPRDGGLFKGC